MLEVCRYVFPSRASHEGVPHKFPLCLERANALAISVFLKKSSNRELPEHLEELLFWQQDLPCSKSLGSESRLYDSKKSKDDEADIPNNLLLYI